MSMISLFLKATAVASVSVLAISTAMAQDVTPLKVFAAQFPGYDLETNTFTKILEGKFKLDVTFDVTGLDGGPAKEKRQITLASGDLPDAFFLIPWVDGFSRAEMLKLGAEGVLVPLNELIDKYAPDVKKALEETPEYKKLATAPDGNIYALPQWNDCYHCSYGSKLWLNTDWLKKLGLEVPKTTEEMRKALLAIKTGDPNGNGLADEIPVTANVRDNLVPYFMNAFAYDPRFSQQYSSTLVLSGDKVVLQAAQDKWRDGLKYIASLYAEGLIDPGAFTQNPDGMMALGNNAEANIVGGATVLHPWAFVNVGQADGRDRGYNAIPPLTGPDGANYATYTLPSSPQGTFAISSTAGEAQQKAAMEMINYIFTNQGHIEGQFGEEGVTWRKAEAGDKALDETLTPTFTEIRLPPETTPPNNRWISGAQYYDTAAYRNAQVQPDDIYSPAGYERRLFQATDLYKGHEPKDQIYPQWNVWFTADEASELAELQTNLDDYVSTTNAEFITGQRDINADGAWADYVKGFDDLGLARFLEIQQKAYDTSK